MVESADIAWPARLPKVEMEGEPTTELHRRPPAAISPGIQWLRSLIVAVVTAIVVYLLLGRLPSSPMRLLSSWTAALVAILIVAWIPMLRSTPASTRARALARSDDPGGIGILMVFIAAGLASLLGAIAIIALPMATGSGLLNRLELVQALVAVAAGWLLMHTAFALHYACLYWGDPEPGGLLFPGDPPDDLDFAYFAFGVGMTFQVSDVTTTSSTMRRTVLMHSLLSFIYNSAILALTINLLASRV